MRKRASLALVVLALVAAWLVQPGSKSTDLDATAEPTSAPLEAVAESAEPAERVEADRSAGPLEIAADRADSSAEFSAADVVDAVDAAKPDELQACGGSWVTLDADGNVAADAGAALERQAVEAVEAPTLAALRASRDPRRQAAALYVDAARVPASRDALARLAAASMDATVYAWAWQVCRPVALQPQPEGSCRMLNAEQWARLDPANAAPWLALAAMAQARRDAVAVDEAMFHAVSARHHDAGSGRLAALLIDAAPADPTQALGVWLLAVRAFADTQPLDGNGHGNGNGIAAADRYCRRDDLADANRRATCERIAVLLASRSNARDARELGGRLGKRLDMPERQRLARSEPKREQARGALDAEAEAEAGAGAGALAQTVVDARVSSCAGLRERLARVRGSGDSADVDALQRAVDAAGRSAPLAVAAVLQESEPPVVGDAAAAATAATAAMPERLR